MQDQAGTVIGGITDVSRPYAPRSMRPASVGSSSRQRSRTSDGSAQSSPMSMTFRGTGRSVAGRRARDRPDRDNRSVSASAQPTAETVVMKFGGSSVADPDKIKHVAQRLVEARERGVRVVATISAMGDTTDGLLSLAQEVSPEPHPRELDMLLSTGERIACALVAMAVHDLGYEAVSFTGSQAGIITDPVHTKAKIREITPVRVVEALDRGRIVLVAGYQGFSRDTMDVTTLGRGGGSVVRDLLGRPRCLHGRPAHRPERAQARPRVVRGDARDGLLRRQGAH